MPDSNWPARTAICLECRTTRTDTEDEHGHWHVHGHEHGHELVSLRDEHSRERLLTRVWGPLVEYHRSSRERLAISAILSLVALFGFFALISPLAGLAGAATAGAGLFALLVAQALRNTEYVLPESELVAERQREHPLPAATWPPRLAGGSAIVATVDAGTTAPAPISGTPAVAFAVILTAGDHETGKLLRDGATVGFSLTTPEGDTIEIAAGSIEVISHGPAQAMDQERIEAYLASLDPLRLELDDDDPFPHEYVAEIVVRPGDHVAVHNPIKRISFAPEGGYRQAARQVFGVQGTPCIELLP